MNIPQKTQPALLAFDNGNLTTQQIAINLVTDMAVSAAYILVLFIIVYLNRKKYISIYVPQKTYIICFAAVFVVNFAASLAALMLPGVAVTLGYKMAVAILMFAIVAAVWRILPRDIDVHERHRLQLENVELQQALRQRDEARASLNDAIENVESKVRARTAELNEVNMTLEKEVIERRLAEERAAESKRRLDELIMRTNTAMVFVDSDGTVLECNHALAQLLGRSTVEELMGRKLIRLLGMKNETGFEHFCGETLRFGTYASDFVAAPPARGLVHIEANGAASVLDGRPCVMALLRDVTERKAAERELLQSREALTAALEVARQANATKSDFLAKMNHELRTPLNGIIGLSEILRHKARGTVVPVGEVRKLTSNIHESGTHLLSLVDDLLDLSRLDSGSRSFSPAMVSVRGEIETAMATLATIADKKRITLQNDCDAELEWTVDQRAFKQIIINLVNNAIKFSPPGSTVKIQVTRSAEAMSLSIIDEGPGIAKKDRKRILSPFGRGEEAETKKIDGVGLGLTIVSELLKLQGGKLTIESEAGRGSVFTAIFPVGADEAADGSPSSLASMMRNPI
ncbi:MAG: PAS domain-containing sensor histidine kinase [Pseudomonadota bacterium]